VLFRISRFSRIEEFRGQAVSGREARIIGWPFLPITKRLGAGSLTKHPLPEQAASYAIEPLPDSIGIGSFDRPKQRGDSLGIRRRVDWRMEMFRHKNKRRRSIALARLMLWLSIPRQTLSVSKGILPPTAGGPHS
jgi:hypothetical protein